jgi:putative redox protein
MLTTMGIVAQRSGIDLSGATARVTKEMVTSPLRRIGVLTVEITVPRPTTEEQQRKLRDAAMACPVHRSMHPDVQMPVTFKFGV